MTQISGRPRRPRSIRRAATVVIAPVALALPLGVFAAVPASADHGRLRACESGGNYRAVNPSGKYRGAYQFDYATWRSVGGSGDPAKASKAEQDRRATILYNRRGNSPWPVCGRGLNLNHGGASRDDDRTTRVQRATVRKAAPAKAKAATKAKRAAHKAPAVKGRAYVVRSGDTLTKIASRYDVDGGWRALFAANKKTVRNPHLIYPGQRLVLPR